MSSSQEAKLSTAEAFEAFGQQFLAQFGPLPSNRKRKSNELVGGRPKKRRKEQSPPQVEEVDIGYSSKCSDSASNEVSESGENSDSNDEEVTLNASNVPVVVFDSDKIQKVPSQSRNGFMSSKISKIRAIEAVSISPMTKKEKANEEEAQQNDRTLYKLIHTKLLSASLDEHSDMSGAKRKKSLQGRVLELATAAKLGKGETAIRKQEHNKAPKHIREGIISKRRERNQTRLEEAKDSGNYHPAIKRLLADPEEPKKRIKRERGIGMGIGKFRGGVLTLGKQEIHKGQGTPRMSSTSGRGRGRGRGPPTK